MAGQLLGLVYAVRGERWVARNACWRWDARIRAGLGIDRPAGAELEQKRQWHGQ